MKKYADEWGFEISGLIISTAARGKHKDESSLLDKQLGEELKELDRREGGKSRSVEEPKTMRGKRSWQLSWPDLESAFARDKSIASGFRAHPDPSF